MTPSFAWGLFAGLAFLSVDPTAAEQAAVVLSARVNNPVGLHVPSGSPGGGTFRMASVRESGLSGDLRAETRT